VRLAAISSAAACTPANIERKRFNRMYGYGSKALWWDHPLKEIRVPAAQRIMTPKKLKTKGHEPMMLRMRSAARSPSESSSRLRTPGCRCQTWASRLYSLSIIPLEIDGIRNPRRGYHDTRVVK